MSECSSSGSHTVLCAPPGVCMRMEQRDAGPRTESPRLRDSASPEERGEEGASGGPPPSKMSRSEVNGSPATPQTRHILTPLSPLGGRKHSDFGYYVVFLSAGSPRNQPAGCHQPWWRSVQPAEEDKSAQCSKKEKVSCTSIDGGLCSPSADLSTGSQNNQPLLSGAQTEAVTFKTTLTHLDSFQTTKRLACSLLPPTARDTPGWGYCQTCSVGDMSGEDAGHAATWMFSASGTCVQILTT